MIINTPLVHFRFFPFFIEIGEGWLPIRGWALINFSYLKGRCLFEVVLNRGLE